jgi:hypothetical protein
MNPHHSLKGATRATGISRLGFWHQSYWAGQWKKNFNNVSKPPHHSTVTHIPWRFPDCYFFPSFLANFLRHGMKLRG